MRWFQSLHNDANRCRPNRRKIAQTHKYWRHTKGNQKNKGVPPDIKSWTPLKPKHSPCDLRRKQEPLHQESSIDTKWNPVSFHPKQPLAENYTRDAPSEEAQRLKNTRTNISLHPDTTRPDQRRRAKNRLPVTESLVKVPLGTLIFP